MEEEDYNSEEIFGGRAQIAYYGDKLNAVAAVMYNDLESDGPPDEYLPNPDDPVIGAVSKEFETVKLVQDFYNQDFFAFNFNLDYDFGPVLFTSATSYFDMEIAKSLDDTYRVLAVTPIRAPWSDYQAWDTSESVIQEIRLSSNNDSRLEWLIGGYYEANDREFLQTQPTPGLNAFFVSIGGPPPCPTLTGPSIRSGRSAMRSGIGWTSWWSFTRCGATPRRSGSRPPSNLSPPAPGVVVVTLYFCSPCSAWTSKMRVSERTTSTRPTPSSYRQR